MPGKSYSGKKKIKEERWSSIRRVSITKFIFIFNCERTLPLACVNQLKQATGDFFFCERIISSLNLIELSKDANNQNKKEALIMTVFI